MKENRIAEIVDKHLQWLIDNQLNQLPGEIHEEMSDRNQDPSEEWRIWFPIKSKVTNDEIKEFENLISHKLPEDYKTLLKYKHFYELYITNDLSFCSHPIDTWRYKLSQLIFGGYPTEFLIDKGLIPFANWSDWGHLCFNTNDTKNGFDYPIVLWDHEVAEKFENKYANFMDMLIKLDSLEKFDQSVDE
jgi:SMI1-KNR4 cell-wall